MKKSSTSSPLPSNHPQKRRRLLKNTTPSPKSASIPVKEITVALSSGNSAVQKPVVRGICTSCHRAAGNTVQCARCLTTTCMVCSRRCTHSATSQPPTPLLTWSPSPSPSVLESPKRSRSVLSSVMTLNCNRIDAQQDSVGQGGKRRRKAGDDEELGSALSVKDWMLLQQAGEGSNQSLNEFGPGCERLVCQKCCYEDVRTNTTTCMDCYGSLL